MKTHQDIESFNQWSDFDKDQYSISVIKGLVMDATRKANSGHPGGPLSCADFAYVLYKHYLKFDPENPNWFNRDRFVLSGGHMSMVQYALLLFIGWLKLEDIKKFRQLNSNTPGHPEVEIPGVECTTGPLGQGFAMATGMAHGEAYLRNIFTNRSIKASNLVDHYTYVLASDGDLQEPVALGSASLAGHLGLSKLIVFYDANEAQISGNTNRSDSTDYKKIFDGFNWHVQEINGHNHDEIKTSIESAQKENRPSIIIGNTIMAKELLAWRVITIRMELHSLKKRLIDLSRNLDFQMKNFIILMKSKNIFNSDFLNFLPWSLYGMMKRINWYLHKILLP